MWKIHLPKREEEEEELNKQESKSLQAKHVAFPLEFHPALPRDR